MVKSVSDLLGIGANLLACAESTRESTNETTDLYWLHSICKWSDEPVTEATLHKLIEEFSWTELNLIYTLKAVNHRTAKPAVRQKNLCQPLLPW